MLFKIIRLFERKVTSITSRSMSTNTVLVEREGNVTLIGINRPEKRNCVDSSTARALNEAIENFENDDAAFCGVLYGVGGNFCAGYDLQELSCLTGGPENFVPKSGTMGPTLRHIKKPLIAAVSGYAVAGGLELSLMCDLRVVEDTAIMGVFCRRFGVPLIDGGTVRLQAMIGLSRALDLILTGRPVEAKEAFQIGLANRVVATGTSLGQAKQLAASLGKFPQLCLRADRNSTFNAAFSMAYQELLNYEQNNGLPIIVNESVQGATKFVSGVGRHGTFKNLKEKSLPEWEKKETEILKKHKL